MRARLAAGGCKFLDSLHLEVWGHPKRTIPRAGVRWNQRAATQAAQLNAPRPWVSLSAPSALGGPWGFIQS